MPTFVYMTRCDGCGQCVDICPSDIMHIDKTYRRALNIEPNMCWECYSCVKACPQLAIDCRGYAARRSAFACPARAFARMPVASRRIVRQSTRPSRPVGARLTKMFSATESVGMRLSSW